VHRAALLLNVVNRPIPRLLFLLWALVGMYDLLLSQFIPPDLAQDAPRVWQILAKAEPFLPGWPFWAWLLILAGLFAATCFEYVVHTVRQSSPQSLPITETRNEPKPVQKLESGREVRQALTLERPKYALPEEAKRIDIATVTNKELGELFNDLSVAMGKMLLRTMRDDSSVQAAAFNKDFAPAFFWLYGEARRRGHRDSDLERYYERPESIKNVSYLHQQFKTLGSRLHLYYDG
jgi:hypothetical protein